MVPVDTDKIRHPFNMMPGSLISSLTVENLVRWCLTYDMDVAFSDCVAGAELLDGCMSGHMLDSVNELLDLFWLWSDYEDKTAIIAYRLSGYLWPLWDNVFHTYCDICLPDMRNKDPNRAAIYNVWLMARRCSTFLKWAGIVDVKPVVDLSHFYNLKPGGCIGFLTKDGLWDLRLSTKDTIYNPWPFPVIASYAIGMYMGDSRFSKIKKIGLLNSCENIVFSCDANMLRPAAIDMIAEDILECRP